MSMAPQMNTFSRNGKVRNKYEKSTIWASRESPKQKVRKTYERKSRQIQGTKKSRTSNSKSTKYETSVKQVRIEGRGSEHRTHIIFFSYFVPLEFEVRIVRFSYFLFRTFPGFPYRTFFVLWKFRPSVLVLWNFFQSNFSFAKSGFLRKIVRDQPWPRSRPERLSKIFDSTSEICYNDLA